MTGNRVHESTLKNQHDVESNLDASIQIYGPALSIEQEVVQHAQDCAGSVDISLDARAEYSPKHYAAKRHAMQTTWPCAYAIPIFPLANPQASNVPSLPAGDA